MYAFKLSICRFKVHLGTGVTAVRPICICIDTHRWVRTHCFQKDRLFTRVEGMEPDSQKQSVVRSPFSNFKCHPATQCHIGEKTELWE